MDKTRQHKLAQDRTKTKSVKQFYIYMEESIDGLV
jgi:hypothetical protein